MPPAREGLSSAAPYERAIHALRARARDASVRDAGELTAQLIAAHAPEVARRLAAEVSAGSYAFQPLVPHAALLNGKPRTIYRIDPLDAVVFAAVARAITDAIEPRLGAHLYSYRKGRSQWTACRSLLRYLHAHERARPDPRARGLFVLRRDVRRYGERIPTGDDSRLWPTLFGLLGGERLGIRGDLEAYLKRFFRPDVLGPDGSARPLPAGVPTGLPTQTIACNAYLLPLDAELCALPGGLYARFGDDILFAHPDLEVARAAARALDEGIARLGLEFNAEKTRALYLTRPGRPHPDAPEFRPCARIAYLGLEVGFDGARLRDDKRRRLWLTLRARLQHADRLLGSLPAGERAERLCRVAAAALERRSPLSDRYAGWLELDVMSVQDLRQLDHHLALAVAERLSGVRGPRAFRHWPKRELRARGLPSLAHRYAEARRRGRRTR